MKTYLLTWVFGSKVIQILEHSNVKIIQVKRKELSHLSQYKNGRFEVRTKEGFKAKPILKK